MHIRKHHVFRLKKRFIKMCIYEISIIEVTRSFVFNFVGNRCVREYISQSKVFLNSHKEFKIKYKGGKINFPLNFISLNLVHIPLPTNFVTFQKCA